MQLYDHPALSARFFPPTSGAPLPVADSMRPVDLALADGTYVGGYWCGGLDRAPVLYLLLGRGELVAEEIARWPLWARDAGANLFMIDYPGHGASAGEASFSAAREAAQAGMRYLLARSTEEVPAIVVLGRSLGSLFALDLVGTHRDRLSGLILETGIADAREWLAAHLPPLPADVEREALLDAFARDFDAQRLLSDFLAPLLVIHPAFGGDVPLAHGDMLATWGCGKLEVVKRGEHDNVPLLNEPEYCRALTAFFADLRVQSEQTDLF